MPLTPPPAGAPRRSVGQARRLLTWRLGVRPALRIFPGHSLGLHGIPSGYAIGSCPRPPAGGTPFAVPAKGVGWRGLPSPHASPVCEGGVSGPLKFGRRILCGSLIPRRSRYIARRHGGLFRRQGARLPRPAGVVGCLPSTTHALGRCLPLAPALCAHALITSAAARCSLSRARGSARRARHRLRACQGARARAPPLLRPLAPLGTLGIHHRRVPSTARRRHTLWGPCQRCGLAGPPVPAPQSRPCGRRLRSLHVGRRVPRAGVWSDAARGGWPNFGSLSPRGPELSSWGRHGEAPDIRVIHSPRRHLPHSTGHNLHLSNMCPLATGLVADEITIPTAPSPSTPAPGRPLTFHIHERPTPPHAARRVHPPHQHPLSRLPARRMSRSSHSTRACGGLRFGGFRCRSLRAHSALPAAASASAASGATGFQPPPCPIPAIPRASATPAFLYPATRSADVSVTPTPPVLAAASASAASGAARSARTPPLPAAASASAASGAAGFQPPPSPDSSHSPCPYRDSRIKPATAAPRVRG